jgi:hypothetical protein
MWRLLWLTTGAYLSEQEKESKWGCFVHNQGIELWTRWNGTKESTTTLLTRI